MPKDFAFDPNLTSEENIAEFFAYLNSVEPDLATLLKNNIHHLVPLPDGAAKASARKMINDAAIKFLEAEKPAATGSA